MTPFPNKPRHGHAKRGARTPTYQSWKAMRSRCRNSNLREWHRYGGRGIAVCARWEVYENFLEDMGERPDGTSLERLNVDGHYEPTNCAWATRDQQFNNQGRSVKITIRGETKTLGQWSKIYGIGRSTVSARIRDGMTPEAALSNPVLCPGECHKSRTHCKHGHEFTTENTRIWKNARICRTCANEAAQRWVREYPEKAKASRRAHASRRKAQSAQFPPGHIPTD